MTCPLNDADFETRARSTWLMWTGMSAVLALLSALLPVAYQRAFGYHFPGQLLLLTLLIILIAALPPVLQWAVMRRLFPRVSPAWWIGLSWLSGLVVTGATLTGWTNDIYQAERLFDLARLRSMVWLGTWAQLAAVGGFWALAFAGLPILGLGWALKRSPIPLLVSTAIGGGAAIIVFKLYQPFFYLRLRSLLSPVDYASAQRSWLELGAIAVAVAAFAMIFGAIQGAGLIYMYRRAAGQADALKRTLATSLPVLGILFGFLLAAHGLRTATSPGTFVGNFFGIHARYPTPPPATQGPRLRSEGLDRPNTSNR